VAAGRLGASVRGIEIDPGLCGLARLNLRLAGVQGDVQQADFFASEPDPVDVLVANPPFSVFVNNPEVLARFELGRGLRRQLSDWLFVEALERWVRPGGVAAVVLPWTVLANPTSEPLRDRIETHWRREVVVGLPEGVFRPFGGAAGRAVLMVLRRDAVGDGRWAEVSDVGWDPRSRHFKQTPARALAKLKEGIGWLPLAHNAWTPRLDTVPGRVVAEMARVRHDPVKPSRDLSGRVAIADLADGDRKTGELTPRTAMAEEIVGPRQHLSPGDVLISRMRPDLGNVVLARTVQGLPLLGTPEWIALEPCHKPHWLLHALRTPTWRAHLPVTTGQTRPRTTHAQVAQMPVPWPGDPLASRVDRLSRSLHDERWSLRQRLDALQRAVDAWSAGVLDDAGLDAELGAIEDDNG
jgi:hypothetical protein